MAPTYDEIIWILKVLSDLKVSKIELVALHCDNQAVIQLVSNPVFHERTNDIKSDCHIVQNFVTEEVMTTKFVSSDEQLIDLFTKALSNAVNGF